MMHDVDSDAEQQREDKHAYKNGSQNVRDNSSIKQNSETKIASHDRTKLHNELISSLAKSTRLVSQFPQSPQTPVFTTGEIIIGPAFGFGNFASVHAVRSIKIKLPYYSTEETADMRCLQEFERTMLATSFAEEQERNYHRLRTTPMNDGRDPSKKPPPRLVLKKILNNLSSARLAQARNDMITEMEIMFQLATKDIQHPNIITLYGIAVNGIIAANDHDDKNIPSCPSLILAKLLSTLTNHINKWRDERGIGWMERRAFHRTSINNGATPHHERWTTRIMVLRQISSAVEHMHDCNILYRDVKPDNIGFDADNVVKVFDFGLARSLDGLSPVTAVDYFDDGTDHKRVNAVYKLTGDTGTPRYMPPEVAFSPYHYGKSADVYSLGILFHHVLSLKVPFAAEMKLLGLRNTSADLLKAVREGMRPSLLTDNNGAWPIKLQQLLAKMWHADAKLRPSAAEVVKSLEDMLRGSNEELFPYAAAITAAEERAKFCI
mmetsp:Transcript_46584/g.68839  ORF Transcript_46584/g.68839 Transcript_46584/m.68839 type:complete len:492 (+) Transcript_46584:17-1492(+)